MLLTFRVPFQLLPLSLFIGAPPKHHCTPIPTPAPSKSYQVWTIVYNVLLSLETLAENVQLIQAVIHGSTKLRQFLDVRALDINLPQESKSSVSSLQFCEALICDLTRYIYAS